MGFFEGVSPVLLLLIGAAIGLVIGFMITLVIGQRELPKRIEAERSDARTRSRATRRGMELERFVPFKPDFPFDPSDCWFLGQPIDFVVFAGLGEGKVDQVVFVEVKTGRSRLNPRQRAIREAVEGRRVSWRELRVEGAT